MAAASAVNSLIGRPFRRHRSWSGAV
jgi:hypothetical protein